MAKPDQPGPMTRLNCIWFLILSVTNCESLAMRICSLWNTISLFINWICWWGSSSFSHLLMLSSSDNPVFTSHATAVGVLPDALCINPNCVLGGWENDHRIIWSNWLYCGMDLIQNSIYHSLSKSHRRIVLDLLVSLSPQAPCLTFLKASRYSPFPITVTLPWKPGLSEDMFWRKHIMCAIGGTAKVLPPETGSSIWL